MEDPQTLLEAVRCFSDLQVCFDYMLTLKYPDGRITCPTCGTDNIGRIATRSTLQCRNKECKKQFSVKLGTIFEGSPLGLDKWFVAVWSIANCKNGISSCELARALGTTQKTAWFMLHRIRTAMRTGTFEKLTGEVESDETYVGGRADNMHQRERERKILGRGSVGKAIVHGLLQRAPEGKSKVMASVIPDTEAETLLPAVSRNVTSWSRVYTDSNPSYVGLVGRFVHRAIDHSKKYVEGAVHTNGLENFFSLLKRAIRGSYVAVAAFHLARYVDEEAFRFNERKDTDGGRFATVMRMALGKRITYRELCALDGAGFMGID